MKSVIIIAVAAIATGCQASTQQTAKTVTVTPPPIVTVTEPAQAPAPRAVEAAPTHASAAGITIPDLAGSNARIAQQQLANLGLTDVSLSSANPKYSMVLNASNWKVVSIEPSPGSVVKADDPIVVKVTKP